MTAAQAPGISETLQTLLAPIWIDAVTVLCIPVTVLVLLRIRRWWNSGEPLPLPLDGALPAVRWSTMTGVIMFALMYSLMYLISAGYAAATGEAGEATPAAAPFSLGVFLAQVIPPLVGLGLVATFGRGTLETVGLRWGRAGPGLVYGAVGFMAAFPVCILALLVSALVLVRLLPSFQPEPPAILKTVQETRQFWVLGLALLQAGILAPLGEELTYRGILMVSLMKSLGAGGAILASALLFGLAHIGAQPQAVLPLFLLGLVLGYAAYRTRSLLAPVVAHALFNCVMVVGTYFKGV